MENTSQNITNALLIARRLHFHG